MIARNDGTKLSSLTNDSPANRENERGRNGRSRRGRENGARPQPPRARSVIDLIRMENDAEIRGFLINKQPLPFGVSDDFVHHHVPGSKRRLRNHHGIDG